MRLEDLDYDLPERLVAQTPLADRAGSRLLVLDRNSGRTQHRRFVDVPELLRPGDLLVMNDTRVTALRLLGRRGSGGKVEALLLQGRDGVFEALMKPAARLRAGESIDFGEIEAVVLGDLGEGRKRLDLRCEGSIAEALARVGQVPLPPYIHGRLEDPERYQTVLARAPGSAAAPTAGLHFTPELLAELDRRGVGLATVTLDVSVDTFRPVTSEDPTRHPMHGERCRVSPEAAERINGRNGRLIAVGTTSVRTLESFADASGQVHPGERVADLLISPGYPFRAVDGMFTNFHLPRTTMLMMISALAGLDAVKRAYHEAVAHEYRFLSFGDSMLIV